MGTLLVRSSEPVWTRILLNPFNPFNLMVECHRWTFEVACQ